jgi:hypothetical protein
MGCKARYVYAYKAWYALPNHTVRIKRRSAFHAHLRRKHDITDVETVKVLRQPLDQWGHASKNTPKTSNPSPGGQFPILWPTLSPQAMFTYPTCSDYRTRPQNDVPSQTIDPRCKCPATLLPIQLTNIRLSSPTPLLRRVIDTRSMCAWL